MTLRWPEAAGIATQSGTVSGRGMTAKLSLVPAFKEREPAFSYLSRVAAANDVPLGLFAQDMGLSLTKILEGDEAEILKLAALTGIDAHVLASWSPVHIGARDHLFRGQVMHAKAIKETGIRGCPDCLREDLAGGDGATAMAVRGDWLFRPVSICMRHSRPLVTLWTVVNKTERYDVAARMAEVHPRLMTGELYQPHRAPAPFDLWISARLLGESSELWLDQFELYPAAHFCELLGRSIWATKIPKWMKFTRDEAWKLFEVGFTFAKAGDTQIRSALHELQEIIGEPTDGPKKKFGDLYDRLAFDLTSATYAPFRALLRDHIATTWPLGPGDDLMGEPVLERKRHSVLTAAREIGMDSRRLRKLLVEKGVVCSIEEGRSDAWELFDAADAKPILEEIIALASATEFQQALGISRSQFELLRRDGYFEPELHGHDHKPLWNVRSGRRFVDSLLTGAEPIYVPMHNWADIPKAAQRLKISPGQIVGLIEKDRLRRVGKHMGRDGYAAILVTTDEVERLLERPDAPGISIEVFARQCGLKPANARRLVRLGHTPSTEGRNPKTGLHQQFLAPGDIAAFHARFVTLRGLAIERGSAWQALRHELAERGILPFSPDGLDYGTVYERVDLAALDRDNG